MYKERQITLTADQLRTCLKAATMQTQNEFKNPDYKVMIGDIGEMITDHIIENLFRERTV